MSITRCFLRGWAVVCLVFHASALTLADEGLTAAQTKFFESKIRPVLVERCYSCHAADSQEIQGGLTLDTREGIRRGGHGGPAVAPKDLRASQLIRAIRWNDKDLKMPPADSGGKLSDDVIRDFETWIQDGAPDPRDGAAPTVDDKWDTSKAKDWWSYQPRRVVAPPTPNDAAWPAGDIDRFVLAKLEEKNLRPVGDAEPAPLLRRLGFDLTGLPPTAEQADDFVRAWANVGERAALLERTVDRMLASPAFGERWGRRWLDVARYAESSGKDVNIAYPHAWRYRDYVIDAFNADTPFDRFLTEQIAGDLLETNDPLERATNLTATGFLAIGAKSMGEMNPRQFALDVADEQIDAVSQAFLGVTVACARCHDHKFDPISQRDYTALAGIFLSTETKFGTSGAVVGVNRSALVELPKEAAAPTAANALTESEYANRRSRLAKLQEDRRGMYASRMSGGMPKQGENQQRDVIRFITVNTQIAQLETQLAAYETDGTPKAVAMGVADRPPGATGGRRRGGSLGFGRGGGRFGGGAFNTIGDSPLFTRGNVQSPTEPVPRGVPELLAPSAGDIPRETSGRLQLAQAMAASDNPLVARVFVNRAWHGMFGRGIVSSVDNFGASGETPSHPELLDWLAQRFVDQGWSIKKLVREIALSRAYRLASTFDKACHEADPDNVWLWRHSSRRLEAEEIRDAILTVSGRLKTTPPTGSLLGRLGDGPIGGDFFVAIREPMIAQADDDRRSIYLPSPRNIRPDVLDVFDLPDASSPCGARETTNVPSQALFLLNSEFARREADSLAGAVLARHPGKYAVDQFDDRLGWIYARALGRPPGETDKRAAWALLERHDQDPKTAWTSLARGLFATAEFRWLD